MARCVRTGDTPRADGRIGLHVLDALLATEEAIASRGFVDVTSECPQTETLPLAWEPFELTLR